MSSQGIKVIFGGGVIGNYEHFNKLEDLEKVYAILEKHGVKNIDSAQSYFESEKVIGDSKAGEKFTIDTKWPGGWKPGTTTKEYIVESAKESIKKMGVKQVDIFYMHCPDESVPLSESLPAINEVYKLGLFKRFGLSNYHADDVQKVYDYAKEHGLVLPTAYQGNYNPVARKQETVLFPTLRKLGIAFYAYSPLAGGFLTKTAQQIADGAGRFNENVIGGMYKQMYGKPSFLKALEKWAAVAEEEKSTKAELAYRWVAHNSPLKKELGDGIIIGASSHEQLEQTLVGIEKGPLSDRAVKAIDEIWDEIKHEAPLDNFNR